MKKDSGWTIKTKKVSKSKTSKPRVRTHVRSSQKKTHMRMATSRTYGKWQVSTVSSDRRKRSRIVKPSITTRLRKIVSSQSNLDKNVVQLGMLFSVTRRKKAISRDAVVAQTNVDKENLILFESGLLDIETVSRLPLVEIAELLDIPSKLFDLFMSSFDWYPTKVLD